ncbi:dual specificity protein kinase splA-like, partial [Rhagoletis pomonella]|uniref:dual specificity protein kinase splA-like n=1 Tax=Rhagoletis pomonella TaxID=28610 RepID=UPI00177E338D
MIKFSPYLCVVSEETMSNADLHPPVPHNEMLHIYTLDSGGSQMTLPSLVGPLTPLTPIEQVANQLNDLQAVVPPLSYFENIIQDHMGSNIGNAPSASSPISKNMRHTNGWDYKLQSPFAHRKISGDSSQPALQIANLSSSTAQQQRFKPPQLLTTFVPAAGNASSSNSTGFTVTAPSVQSQPNTSTIETVAITTTPVNVPSTLSSPKHFFAPLKPRLKLNTDLANKTTNNTNVPGVPPLSSNPTTAAVDVEANACQNCDPPDLYVHNGVASPYQRQIATATSAAHAVPPPVPQRGSSSQVSPQHRARAHHQHQYMQEWQQQQSNMRQHLHPHQYSHQYQQQHQRPLQQQHSQLHSAVGLPQSVVTITVTVDDADEVAAGADTVAASGTDAAVAATAVPNNLAVKGNRAPSAALINSPLSLQASLYATATIPVLQSPAAMPAVFVAQPNTVITKLSEPIYATAQKRSKSLITAPALTKPLVAAIITPTKRPTPTTSNKSSATATPVHSPIPVPTPTSAPKAMLVDGHSQ